MAICWIYRTVANKRVKVLANDIDAEYKLLKENHKKDRFIDFLEKELRNDV